MFGGFGAPQAVPPNFVNPFAPPAAAAPAFGGGFGAPPAAAAPAFGGGFGAAAPVASAPAFGMPAPAFGAAGIGGFANFGTLGAPAPAPGSSAQPQNLFQGFEGELRKFLDVKRAYAPVKKPGDETPSGLDKIDNRNSSSLATFPWNDDCQFKFTQYIHKKYAKAYKDEYHHLDAEAGALNPKPSELFPRTLMGISELKKRFDSQNEEVDRVGATIKAIKDDNMEELKRSNDNCAIRIQDFQLKHNSQVQTLMRLLRDVEYLRNRNRPLEKSEIEHRAEYDKLLAQKELCSAKLNQLENANNNFIQDQSQNLQEEYLDISDEDLDRIYYLLKEQHDGIHHLAKILQKDYRDVEIIIRERKEGMMLGP